MRKRDQLNNAARFQDFSSRPCVIQLLLAYTGTSEIITQDRRMVMIPLNEDEKLSVIRKF